MAKKQIEFKTFPFKIKDVSQAQGIIEGYASTFGNVDLGMDIVDQGAFKKTLLESGQKFPILADHDPAKQIGWNLNGEEDQTGLLVKGELDIENNQLAKERFSLAQKALQIGAKSGLSIGFMTIKSEPDTKNPMIRHLKELKLFEYSFVTFPMNENALALAAKSWLEQKDLGLAEYTDMFFKHMEGIGFKFKEVDEALKKRAATSIDPNDRLIQSIDRAISTLKSA